MADDMDKKNQQGNQNRREQRVIQYVRASIILEQGLPGVPAHLQGMAGRWQIQVALPMQLSLFTSIAGNIVLDFVQLHFVY